MSTESGENVCLGRDESRLLSGHDSRNVQDGPVAVK